MEDSNKHWLGFAGPVHKLLHELGNMEDILHGRDGLGFTQEVKTAWEQDFPAGTIIGDLVRAIEPVTEPVA